MQYSLARVAVCAVVPMLMPTLSWAADPDSLLGVHFWGPAEDSNPAAMLNSQENGGWTLEVVNTRHYSTEVPYVQWLYGQLKTNYNVSPITRIGYEWGNTMPAPGTPEHTNWPTLIANDVVKPLKDLSHLWVVGNEPDYPAAEAKDWPNQYLSPADYAQMYRRVRSAIHNTPDLVGAAGQHQVLLTPIGVPHYDYQEEILKRVPAAEIDGMSIHVYAQGSTVRSSLEFFRAGMLNQLQLFAQYGLQDKPVYLTEWGRYMTSGAELGDKYQERITAQFAREALTYMDRWNRTPGNQNIVASTWFVYASSWGHDGMSIDYQRIHGLGMTDPRGLYKAFYDTARKDFQAGVTGARPMPAHVHILEDFENGDDRFNREPDYVTVNTTGLLSSSTHLVQSDRDSYTQFNAKLITLNDDPARSGGWVSRYVSGDSQPMYNQTITLDPAREQHIGFMLRVYARNGSSNLTNIGPLSVQIVLDSGAGGGINSDAGIRQSIIADGQWHLYEWDMSDPSQWTVAPFGNGSDGLLGVNKDFRGNVTLDSIYFYGGDVSVQFLLDTVMWTSNGDLQVMAGIPEPATAFMVLMLGAGMIVRRSCRA